MRIPAPDLENCPDCNAKPESLHSEGCDVECCADCGGQRIGCDCDGNAPRIKWSGLWPGVFECRDFGWFAKFVDGEGWVRCAQSDPGATEDLNRLFMGEATWDVARSRWALRS